MKTIDRIIGLWMMFTGATVFVYALSLGPYFGTISGYTLYVVAFSTSVLLGAPSGALIGYGLAQSAGLISINIEGGK